MTNLPWMQIYIGDELAETSHMTAEEYGAHMFLRLHQWKHGELPTDEERLMRISHVERDRWPVVKEVLAPLFDWVWHHQRTAEVRRQSEEKHANLSANGRKGGRPKKADGKPMESHGFDRDKAEYKADGKQSQPQSPSHSHSNPRSGSPAPAPSHDGAYEEGGEGTSTRPFPVPKSVDEGKNILLSRGCPPDEMKRCLAMMMEGHLTPFDIEAWDIKARVA